MVSLVNSCAIYVFFSLSKRVNEYICNDSFQKIPFDYDMMVNENFQCNDYYVLVIKRKKWTFVESFFFKKYQNWIWLIKEKMHTKKCCLKAYTEKTIILKMPYSF